MERLTTKDSVMGRKHDLAYGIASSWKKKLKNDRYEIIENAVDKLGELEDIEEKIGISLETLFKAMENGIYYVNDSSSEKEILFAKPNRVSLLKYKGHYSIWVNHDTEEYFEDYGKTWALEKEKIEAHQQTLKSLTLNDYLSKIGMTIDQFLEIFNKGIWRRNYDGLLEHWESWDIHVHRSGFEYEIFRTSTFGIENVCDFGKTWWIEKPTEE